MSSASAATASEGDVEPAPAMRLEVVIAPMRRRHLRAVMRIEAHRHC